MRLTINHEQYTIYLPLQFLIYKILIFDDLKKLRNIEDFVQVIFLVDKVFVLKYSRSRYSGREEARFWECPEFKYLKSTEYHTFSFSRTTALFFSIRYYYKMNHMST